MAFTVKIELNTHPEPIEGAVQPSDFARLEALDPAFAKDLALAKQNPEAVMTLGRLYMLGYIVMGRLGRTGKVHAGNLPQSYEEFLDCAEVGGQDDEVPDPLDDRTHLDQSTGG